MINHGIIRFNERQADIDVVQSVQRDESVKEIKRYVNDWKRASKLKNIKASKEE